MSKIQTSNLHFGLFLSPERNYIIVQTVKNQHFQITTSNITQECKFYVNYYLQKDHSLNINVFLVIGQTLDINDIIVYGQSKINIL